jgi:hypothetical protein
VVTSLSATVIERLRTWKKSDALKKSALGADLIQTHRGNANTFIADVFHFGHLTE